MAYCRGSAQEYTACVRQPVCARSQHRCYLSHATTAGEGGHRVRHGETRPGRHARLEYVLRSVSCRRSLRWVMGEQPRAGEAERLGHAMGGARLPLLPRAGPGRARLPPTGGCCEAGPQRAQVWRCTGRGERVYTQQA